MKVSISPRRISRRVAKSLGILFILALVVMAYAFTALTAYADGTTITCPPGSHATTDPNTGAPICQIDGVGVAG